MRKGLPDVEILIADRDDHLRSALKLMLTNDHNNINITEVGNVEDVKQMMGVARFNLVIIDWILQRNGAKELITTFRERQPDIIIIVLSMRMEDQAAALKAGANAFVYKGDPPEHLHNTLLTYLESVSKTLGRMHSVLPSGPRPIYCHYLV